MPPDAVLDEDKTQEDQEAHRRARGDFVDEDEKDEKDDELDPDDLAAVAGEDDHGVAGEDGKSKAVPYAKFKDTNDELKKERERALRLEGENEALRKQAKPAEEAKPDPLKALRKQLYDANQSGDEDKALAVQEQIDGIIQDRATTAAEAKAEATTKKQLENQALAEAADDVVEKYPYLDSTKADTLDEEALEDVMRLRNSLHADGMPLDKALRKAADRICGRIEKAKAKEADAEDDKGKKDDDPQEKRRKQALARGANAANNQPAAPIGGRGNRSTSPEGNIDVAKLTDEEFSKLPPAEKARLRGDAVTE